MMKMGFVVPSRALLVERNNNKLAEEKKTELEKERFKKPVLNVKLRLHAHNKGQRRQTRRNDE